MSEAPVNKVYVSDSGRQFIVEECVLCGDTHRHGAKDRAVAAGGRSTRAGHCSLQADEYYLELADDADPPEIWRNWMRNEFGVVVDR